MPTALEWLLVRLPGWLRPAQLTAVTVGDSLARLLESAGALGEGEHACVR